MNALAELLYGIAEQAATAVTPTPTRIVVSPGDVETWDDCCDGMVWLRVDSLVATGNRGDCGPAFTDLTLELGVLRCETGSSDSGEPPTSEQINADTSQVYDDMDAVRYVLGCEVTGAKLDQWVPVGPQGGCIGGKWIFRLRVVPTRVEVPDEEPAP